MDATFFEVDPSAFIEGYVSQSEDGLGARAGQKVNPEKANYGKEFGDFLVGTTDEDKSRHAAANHPLGSEPGAGPNEAHAVQHRSENLLSGRPDGIRIHGLEHVVLDGALRLEFSAGPAPRRVEEYEMGDDGAPLRRSDHVAFFVVLAVELRTFLPFPLVVFAEGVGHLAERHVLERLDHLTCGVRAALKHLPRVRCRPSSHLGRRRERRRRSAPRGPSPLHRHRSWRPYLRDAWLDLGETRVRHRSAGPAARRPGSAARSRRLGGRGNRPIAVSCGFEASSKGEAAEKGSGEFVQSNIMKLAGGLISFV